MKGTTSICFSCARFVGITATSERATCEAFPDGIPDLIAYGAYDHRNRHPDDNGLTHLLDPERADDLATYEEYLTSPFGPPARVVKHLAGQHNQQSHGNRGGFRSGTRTFAPHSDLASSPDLDADTLPDAYLAAMDKRAAKLGIGEDDLVRRLDAHLDRADPALIASAQSWYGDVHDAASTIADRYDIPVETVAGAIAAMSPAREFSKNLRDAHDLIALHEANEPFVVSQEAYDAYEAARARFPVRPHAPAPGTVVYPRTLDATRLVALHPVITARMANSTGFDGVIRAASILKGADPATILGGAKVRSFYSNIMNPHGNRVTIDTWMYRAMTPPRTIFTIGKVTGTLRELEAAGKRTQDLFQGVPSGHGVGKNVGLYPMFADAVRRVARRHNMTPAALQAVVWEQARIEAGYRPTDLESLLDRAGL